MKQKVSVLVTDLDNTLYDWFAIWYGSFRPMLERLVEESGVPEGVLCNEIRAIHQRYGTSEYSHLIEELPSLQKKHGGADLAEVYRSAIEAFRKGREDKLKLYPGVFETLWELKRRGSLIVGYTESRAFYTNYRVRKLCLDGLLDYLYSPADHDLPPGISREELRRYPPEHYALKVTKHRHTPEGELKPNPDILLSMIREVGAAASETAYVGDSEMKDIAMAQDTGITDVLARYGAVQHREEYVLLQSVSHWREEDVQREMAIKERGAVTPNFALNESFSELLDLFDFKSFHR